MRTLLYLTATCVLVAAPLMAQDNVEGPWGTHNGDNFGRQRTTAPAGDWSPGIEMAWQLDVRSNGLDRVAGRNQIVFDAEGNIYWITSIGGGTGGAQFLASVDPDGNIRWSQQVKNPAAGAFTQSSPVVGMAAVYAVGGGDLYDYDGDGVAGHFAGAFNKADGHPLWTLDLDGDWDNNGSAENPLSSDAYGPLSPVLYDGKLYVALIGGHGLGVVQITAATGTVDWYSLVDGAITYSSAGSMVHVPGIFDGDDGLFFNLDEGGNPGAIRDVIGVQIDPLTGASLAWTAAGGNLARAHLVYSPVTGYLYACTWWDQEIVPGEGSTGYAVYDPADGTIIDVERTGNYGFYDVVGLDFDDTSVIAGSFNGIVISHEDANMDGVLDQLRMYKAHDWYGEHRVFGQLAQHDGDTLLISGTNSRADTSRSDAFGPDYTARVVVYNLGQDLAVPTLTEDGPMYVDDIEIYEGVDYDDAIANPPVYSEDFEGFTPGDVSNDPDWTNISGVSDPNYPDPGPPQVLDDPTGEGHGNVLMFDAIGDDFQTNSGATVDLPEVGGYEEGFVVVRWKQWRQDATDNVDANPSTQLGTFQWDLVRRIYIPWDVSGPLKDELWQDIEVRYNFDFPNDYVDIWVDGWVGEGTPPFMDDPNAPISDWTFNMSPTPEVTYPVPQSTPVAEWETGIIQDHGYTVRGGPLLGPDGKIYYFDAVTGYLVALKPISEGCAGDVDGDGDTDLTDLAALLAAYGYGLGDPQYNPNADYDSNDIVNLSDLAFLLADYGCGTP